MQLTRYTKDNPPSWANDPIETDATQQVRLARRVREQQATKVRRQRRQSRASRKRNRGH